MMKKYLIWLWILSKRLLLSPAFLCSVLWLPLAIVAIDIAESHFHPDLSVAVYAGKDDFSKKVGKKLLQNHDMVRFYLCESEKQVKQDVKNNKALCGYVLKEGMEEELMAGNRRNLIKVYADSSSMQTSLMNQLVFADVLCTYAPDYYESYMKKVLKRVGADGSEMMEELSILNRKYTENGSTFSFEIYGEGKAIKSEAWGGLVPARGLMAVMIFLCGLCGLMDWKRNQQSGKLLFSRTSIVAKGLLVFLPICFGAVVGLLCLWFTGDVHGMLKEICSMILYILLLNVFLPLIGLLFKSEEGIISITPFWLLGCLVICPIFFDFSILFSPIRLLRILFPPSWYLDISSMFLF